MCALALTLPAAAHAQGTGKPFTLEDVEELVRAGVEPLRIHERIKHECVDFHLDSVSRARLEAAGATEEHFSGLKKVCVRVPPAPAARASPPIPSPRPAVVVVRPPVTPLSEPLPPAPESSSHMGAAELLVGVRLEVQTSGSDRSPRSFVTFDAMTRSLNGWRVGVGVAGAVVAQESTSEWALMRVDGRLSVALSEEANPFALQAYATLGTLFNPDTLEPGARISAGVAIETRTPMRFCLDLAHEWRPESLPFEPRGTMLSFGLSWNFAGADQ